jgi:hypothetical protein
MLAPHNKTLARLTLEKLTRNELAELKAEADRLLALYEEPKEEPIDGIEDESCRYRLSNGNPVHPNCHRRSTHLSGGCLFVEWRA